MAERSDYIREYNKKKYKKVTMYESTYDKMVALANARNISIVGLLDHMMTQGKRINEEYNRLINKENNE